MDHRHPARVENVWQGQEEQIAHELKIITPANLHKTAS